MPSLAGVVRAQQQAWAKAQDIPTDAAGYTLRLGDNLFVPLSDESVCDFKSGDGAELGDGSARGKMQALHSSSALACNVFEYWRQRDPAPLANALDLTRPISTIRFEQKFPTGLHGKAPNLDVVLGLQSGHRIAIESKFLEPYTSSHTQKFNPKYFEGAGQLWADRGLPACQELASSIDSGAITFRWLDAQQLLKHALGLAKAGNDWCLWCIWYQVDGSAGVDHAAEAEQFAKLVAPDQIGFRAITYQSLFQTLLTTCSESDMPYLEYVGSRYFNKKD